MSQIRSRVDEFRVIVSDEGSSVCIQGPDKEWTTFSSREEVTQLRDALTRWLETGTVSEVAPGPSAPEPPAVYSIIHGVRGEYPPVRGVPMRVLQAAGSLENQLSLRCYGITDFSLKSIVADTLLVVNPEKKPNDGGKRGYTQVHLWPSRIVKEDVPAYREVWQEELIPDALEAVLEAVHQVSLHCDAADPARPPVGLLIGLKAAIGKLRTAMRTVLGRQPQ